MESPSIVKKVKKSKKRKASTDAPTDLASDAAKSDVPKKTKKLKKKRLSEGEKLKQGPSKLSIRGRGGGGVVQGRVVQDRGVGGGKGLYRTVCTRTGKLDDWCRSISLKLKTFRCRRCFPELPESEKKVIDTDLEAASAAAPLSISRPRTRSSDVFKRQANPITEELVEKDAASANEPFSKFRISEATQETLKKRGITELFPIQSATFDPIYDGKDVIGRARTGMGKTLAFALPVIEKLILTPLPQYGRVPKVLCLSPTRELAIQIGSVFEETAPALRCLCVYGGTSINDQVRSLRRGMDVLIGTPGRVMDLLDRQVLDITQLNHFILDEADRMLDMGFKDDIQKVFESIAPVLVGEVAQEKKVQVLLFSATMPPYFKEVANKYMGNDRVTVDLVKDCKQKASTDVEHLAIKIQWQNRDSIIGDILTMYGGNDSRTIVFVDQKKDANELEMAPEIKQECHALHGDIIQKQREISLKGFKDGAYKVLIATDVAARGLDMRVDLVLMVEPPKKAQSMRADVESYVHRSGRTGRAGRKGICITLFTHKQEFALKDIERGIGNKIKVIGAPQATDIVKSIALKQAEALKAVHDDVLPHFQETANSLIESMGAEKCVAAAIAVLSGYTQPILGRSLLTGSEGFRTIMFCSPQPIFSTSYVWNAVNKVLYEGSDKIRGMQLGADTMCAVFDLPTDLCTHFQKLIDEGDKWYKFTTELPALKEAYRAPARKGGGWGKGGGKGGKGGFRGGKGKGGKGGSKGKRSW
jgi:ATP-dependent RNA helicase DDX21